MRTFYMMFLYSLVSNLIQFQEYRKESKHTQQSSGHYLKDQLFWTFHYILEQ